MSQTPTAFFRLLLILASAVGAALLFWVQPMVGRLLLPHFGGTATVWTMCLLTFQTLLFLGYFYAHKMVLSRTTRTGWHTLILLMSLPLVYWFFVRTPTLMTVASPTISVALSIVITAGLPYLLLASTSPVIQSWARGVIGNRVYGLYAWSNAGSLLGLLVYPLLLEPRWPLSSQRKAWGIAYLGFVLLMIGLSTMAKDSARHDGPSTDDGNLCPMATSARLKVGLLSATGVVLLMAITETLSTDLTVTPLLWVLPLTVYLLTLILVFGHTRPLPRLLYGGLLVAALALMTWLLFFDWRAHWTIQVGVWCAGLGAACLACHAEMVRLKPPAKHLTDYYLSMAFGGACGGIFAGAIAPLIFPVTMELYIGLLACWFLFGWCWLADLASNRPLQPREVLRGGVHLIGLTLILAFSLHGWARMSGETRLYRSFYGALQVKYYPSASQNPRYIHLLDGRISHGFQYLAPEKQDFPTTYFVPQSGIGRLLDGWPAPKRVAVLGLGTGTLAAYARKGDHFVFYEINPDVAKVARSAFTYLRRAKGEISVHLGDGRKRLEEALEQHFDIIIFDAFSGDAIPAHLMTEEAVGLALSRLRPGGVLAINVSNNHADMKPVIWSHARVFNLAWRRVRHEGKSPFGPYISDWMFVAPREGSLAVFEKNAQQPKRLISWTDDHAPLLPILY